MHRNECPVVVLRSPPHASHEFPASRIVKSLPVAVHFRDKLCGTFAISLRVQTSSQNCEKLLLVASSRLSVRPHGKISASPGRIFMKIYILLFYENLSGTFKIR